MLGLFAAGIESCSLENASELMGPYFEASVLRMEVSESNFCLQLQFEYQASGPLVQQDHQAKQVLEIVQSWDVVFSSDRSSDRFTGKSVSQSTGLYYEYSRWYDPSIGRFISLDSSAGQLSDPQSQNGYTYARDLPTVLVDPSGAAFDCNYSLCEGPAFFMSSEDISKIADPYLREVCYENPMICGDVLSYYGYDLDADTVVAEDAGGVAGTSQIISPAPGPTITVSDTTPTITDINPTIATEPSTSVEPTSPSTGLNWPANAQVMDDLLGEPGTSIPDTATTPGRGQNEIGDSFRP